jgi:SAM-dependent methyltransferase
MMREAAEERARLRVLDNGCGIGIYLERIAENTRQAHGLEFDFARALEARARAADVVQAAGERLPYADGAFDLVLSHEVLEHVDDDQAASDETIRVLKPGGRLLLFVPNRGYPFETHGIYWRGKYRFGNIPLVNYLPAGLRNRLAPHVRVYSSIDLEALFQHASVRVTSRTVIFGAYDNIIARWPRLGRALRDLLHWLERTPLRSFGLSHFWVIEKI